MRIEHYKYGDINASFYIYLYLYGLVTSDDCFKYPVVRLHPTDHVLGGHIRFTNITYNVALTSVSNKPVKCAALNVHITSVSAAVSRCSPPIYSLTVMSGYHI